MLFTNTLKAENTTKDCVNCFSSKLLSMEKQDNCISIQLEITGLDCIHALSHFTVEVPCGNVSSASNTGEWTMELNSTDPTTGVYGIKVDDIQNFGEGTDTSKIILEYTICSDNAECINTIKTSPFEVAYKAAEYIFIDVIEPDQPTLEASLNTSDISCHGDHNGRITTTITSGQAPFTFYWSNGATTQNLDNIPAGSYELTITDNNGESLTLTATVNEPEAITAQASIQHANCGANDGTIEVTASGGSEPYTYLWNTGVTSPSINQLAGGLYTLEVTDINGCSQTLRYTIQDKTTLQATITADILECHQEGEGTLEAKVTGGFEPYTYLWDNGDTSSVATNLNSDPHKVIITDAAGCSIEKTGYVIIDKLNASATTTDPVCYGEADGNIQLSINNGTAPYSIKWNNGDTTMVVSNLEAGWYWADITDANGCTFRKYVNIKAPREINLNASITRGSCAANDSSINVKLSASGGTAPYTFYHNGAEADVNFTTNKTGYYTFSVTDANGCSNTDSILVTRPEAKLNSNINLIQPDCSNPVYGSANITITDGTEPYTIAWSDGSDALSRNDLTAGEYHIIITDANSCTSEHNISINHIDVSSVEIIALENMPDCSSNSNVLNAYTNNAASFNWSVSSSNTGWTIENKQSDQLTYSAGQGEAWIKLVAISTDGCLASDSILLSCQNQDIEQPDDSIPGNDDCSLCYEIIPTNIWKLDDQCYKYAATVKTDGSCRHDLSHMSILVTDGEVQFVNNSEGWKTEQNSTDPTTGIYGFKIDDISNFGNTKDQFNIEYTICFNGEPQREFIVAYKSGQCVVMDTINFNQKHFNTPLTSNSYPNPFTDATQIEFTAKITSNAKLCIYDLYGNLVECLYDGSVNANTHYSFEFRADNTSERMFFYRLICGNEVTQGKLMKVR